MNDITLLYDADAEAWSSYIMEFISPMTKKCKSANIQEKLDLVVKMCEKCFVLVILMSPAMLDDLAQNAGKVKQVFEKHSNVVTILCHTSKKDVEENLKEYLPFVDSFKYFNTEDTKEKNREMVAEILDILSTVQDKSVPLPFTKQMPIKSVCPDYITRKDEKILIVFKREIRGTIQVSFEKDGKRTDTKKLNPYCARFNAPERNKLGRCRLYIYEDNKLLAEWRLHFTSPSLAAYESFEFLAQCLDIDSEDRNKIDARLASLFEDSTPGDDELSKFLTPSKMGSVQSKTNLRFPTLLHFAAYHGLPDLCSCLLDFPGSFSAFVTCNKDGKNPAELAAESGHQELADFLEMFMETEAAISDMGEVYEQMVGHSLYYNENKEDTPGYMEGIAEAEYVTGEIAAPAGRGKSLYKMARIPETSDLPPPRDTSRQTLDRSAKTRPPPPTGKKPVLPAPTKDPVKQISTQPDRPKPPASLPTTGPTPAEFIGITSPTNPNVFNKYRDEGSPELYFNQPTSPLGQNLDELKDIQEGFKRGEFNMVQVQQLYAAWKDRNREGSNSMKERQKQLQELRQKHAEILTKATNGKKQSQIGKWKSRLSKASKLDEDSPLKIEHIPSSNPYGTLPNPYRRPSDGSLQQRLSNASTISSSSSASSSSSGTRDSAVSCHDMSDDDENYEENPVVLRSSTKMSLGQQLRRSQIETIEEEPPPPPPRPSARLLPRPPAVFPRK